MSSNHAHALASFGSPVTTNGLFQNLSASVKSHFAKKAEHARIRRELNSYTDRQLNDLGLSRLDIDAVATGRHNF